jgi:hypothetical protein
VIRLLFSVIILFCLSPDARAQDRSRRLPTLRISDTLEGKADEPLVELLIVRENLKMEYELALEESFVPKIWESVEQRPF